MSAAFMGVAPDEPMHFSMILRGSSLICVKTAQALLWLGSYARNTVVLECEGRLQRSLYLLGR